MSQTNLLVGYSYNQSVTPGWVIPLSTLFTYSYYSDSVAGFDVEQKTDGGGYLTDNGIAMTPGVMYGNSLTGLPISQIGQWAFVAGPAGSSDTIGFNVDDSSGNFSQSVYATVTVPQSVAAPTTPTATGPGSASSPGTTLSGTNETLSWNAVSGATSYEVAVRDITTGTNGPLVVDQVVSGTSYSVSLTTGHQYRWDVDAINSAGASSFTAPLYFQIGGSTPPSGSGAAGFDRRAYPGNEVMKTLKSDTNLSWVGYYLDAPSQQTDTGWLGTRGYLQGTLGWQIAPLYVGAQDPALGGDNTFVSQTDPTAQGTADAKQAIDEMGNSTALQTVYEYDSANNSYVSKQVPVGQGFKAGTVVYLDWENSPISSSGNNIQYIKAWCDQVAASSYVPGIYCPSSDISVISNAVAADNVVFWAGTWEGGSQPAVQSTTTSFLKQPPTAVANASSVQYGAGYQSIDNGLLSNVDLDTSSLYVACFASGTRIATADGDRPVESLAVGDTVIARSQGSTAIVWLGHRHVDCRHHPRPQDVWPVRIRAGAFARGVPRRDLVLSPDHAVFVRGVLIPARYLVNGATIVQEPRDEITYWHVELAQHDLLLAEGLACESYLDTGNRAAFANGGGTVMLHPDFAWQVWAIRACAPLVLDGPERTAARRRLLARAARLGHVVTNAADLHLLADGVPRRGSGPAGPLHRFKVGGRVKELRIVSRSGVPAEVHADGTDHRRLGVMIQGIAFFGSLQSYTLTPADIPTGCGFYRLEEEGGQSWRWTDGDALLPIPAECARDGILHVELLIGTTANYWLPAPASAGAASGCAPGKRAYS